MRKARGILAALVALCSAATDAREARGEEPPLRLVTFQVDATPPLGSPLCGGVVKPAREVVDPLSCRGVALLTAEGPIVLCAVDWVGIANGGHDAWRNALAEAAGTTPGRVAVHCLHQHDAPSCDFDAEALLAARGVEGKGFDPEFARATIARAAAALRRAMASPRRITHVGLGSAEVREVASSRRVLGPDGKVKYVRYSSTKDPKARAAPEGIVDPLVRAVGLWDGESCVASLTYYATHPQSHYGQGGVSCDFVGLARGLRERSRPGTFQLHFCGAAGNVTAGKYNDGSPENRPRLARRLADGMEAALDASAADRAPATAADVGWRVVPVALPVAPSLVEGTLAAQLEARPDFYVASNLAWVRRRAAGHRIELSCLRLGRARVLHLPGELFVEYQLAAQRMRPDLFVAVAAYGDDGPGYIGTRAAYPQGGYEVGPPSHVAPEVEDVLATALARLLDVADAAVVRPSSITEQAPRLGAAEAAR